MSEETKLLGAQVSKELHRLAHLTARVNGQVFSDWLRDLVEANIDPQARALHLSSTAQSTKQNNLTERAPEVA